MSGVANWRQSAGQANTYVLMTAVDFVQSSQIITEVQSLHKLHSNAHHKFYQAVIQYHDTS